MSVLAIPDNSFEIVKWGRASLENHLERQGITRPQGRVRWQSVCAERPQWIAEGCTSSNSAISASKETPSARRIS
jgi:hypothetical protein